METLPSPKPSDDPHDIVVVAPDAIKMSPAEDVIESLLKGARASSEGRTEPRLHAEPSVHAEPLLAVPEAEAAKPVPPVDTTFRATAVNDGPFRNRGRAIAARLLRGAAALVLAACIGGAAMAWRYHGDTVRQIIAEWAPLFVQKSAQVPEKTGLASPPVLAAADADAATAAPSQPAPAGKTAAPSAIADTAAPVSSDGAQSLEAMARDLASANQQIEQLKATVEQLKAGQQQLLAMVAEKAAAPSPRPKKPAQVAPPPRPVAALTPAARAPAPPPPAPPRSYRPAAAPVMTSSASAPLPPAAPAYVPPPPQTAVETLNDPELPSVPRPPMPLR